MTTLSYDTIRNDIADSAIIFRRGEDIYENDDLLCVEKSDNGFFKFRYDGNYGEYEIVIDSSDASMPFLCDCPYPGDGCKHIVAALLTVLDMKLHKDGLPPASQMQDDGDMEPMLLTREEIRAQALEDRHKRAKSEKFKVILGDMFKDEHLVESTSGKQYTVVMHDPEKGVGHCSCPDFLSNRLGICKHMIYLKNHFDTVKKYKKQVQKEEFPFADIFWDSKTDTPKLFYDPRSVKDLDLVKRLTGFFDQDGVCLNGDLGAFFPLIPALEGNKKVRIQPEVVKRVDRYLQDKELQEVKKSYQPDYSLVKTTLYPYQKEGIDFGLFRRSTLIGDEMGLGKTLQAITLSLLKKELFGFKNVLIVTLASLKEQWHREIRKFTGESAVIIAGAQEARRRIYRNSSSYFKITNYEAVLRDITIISEMRPDIIILDEAQRIKNFNTKTADAVKQLPREHAIVLTGTPLENKLEDVYSIVQFLDPPLLSPLWDFAGKYYMMLRKPKGKISGYTNLSELKNRLSNIVIRRKKDEVLKDLPDTITNNYYIDLTDKQEKLHAGFKASLIPILSKKFLTPIDLQRIQMFLLKMRMVCNSTYLIDKKTHLSPKLKEFESIIQDLVVENNRKVVVFSEWTTMTFLIAKCLSKAKIQFVELSGKIPVTKRQKLIDAFTNNPSCSVFLSTDAGGTGLNLQAADCVINFELPWNPARLSQRTGRVNRIGQKSNCINVINLIAKRSIEEKILSGLELKRDLFKGVFEDGQNTVDFSNEKRASLLNRLREMMGEDADVIPQPEKSQGEEIPDDTPYFLNPEVLNPQADTPEEKKDTDAQVIDFASEEPEYTFNGEKGSEVDKPAENEIRENVFEGQSAEKIETVLNSGMAFISGLLEMATGKTIEKSGTQEKLLTIDRQTGEVTMKFRLPGM
ncbi:MAG: DEAD/DEAH box helicase [Proteobacteria bacterium]|nr:DEAD/DEAH box helicase [Pseudomonadota bacterium]